MPKAFQPEKPKASRIILPVAAGVGRAYPVICLVKGRNAASDTATLNSQIAGTNSRIEQVRKDTATIKDQITKLQSQVQPIQDQIKTTEASATTFTNLVDNMTNSRNTTSTNDNQIWALVPSGLS